MSFPSNRNNASASSQVPNSIALATSLETPPETTLSGGVHQTPRDFGLPDRGVMAPQSAGLLPNDARGTAKSGSASARTTLISRIVNAASIAPQGTLELNE
jgi:hypothetical protein